MENQEVDITALKSLESPRDIVNAVIGVNRENNGKVLVELAGANGEGKMLLHPAYLQREADEPNRESNLGPKLGGMIEHDKMRITRVIPIEDELINAQGAMPPVLRLQKALKIYAKESGFEEDKSYPGRFVENKKEE